MVLKRFTSIIQRKTQSNHDDEPLPEGDTPEANAARGVKLFCESGGPNTAGEEVLHLPTIVEAAESSPAAAGVAAAQIRKFLSKDYSSRPHVQYNAIMLIRILVDNPGPTFTKYLDSKFTGAVKDLLRNGKDPSVRQILHETLNAFYYEKAYDTNLSLLNSMWTKELGPYVPPPNGATSVSPFGAPQMTAWPQQEAYSRGSPRYHHSSRALPPPPELAARIEEARTSAKLLLQLCQSSTPDEMQANDLIKEFADRCQTAQRSLQGYMNCDDPVPDDATMQTMIETSEQLSLAASKHHRALLAARRAAAPTASPPPSLPPRDNAPPAPSSTTTPSPLSPLESPLPPIPTTLQAGIPRRNPQTTSPTAPPNPYDPTTSPYAPPGAPAAHGNLDLSPQPTDNPFSDEHAAEHQPPTRPGFAATPSSYTRRQENAMGGEQMRGAVPSVPEEDEGEEERRTEKERGTNGGGGAVRESREKVSPVEERVTYRY
ncbi:hypothetical protein P152DRAFT_459416 [Eremomyces bilateralis CBS 781.70]|uniref:GAT domain-containing protein n=1 Tax=Eremomyces bilateralis CBS 781.70 TaxID=1392243 RepID=A0A6G1G0Z5_9PEZI|nr:uncharacterized protein P152DRAFT_459416 [Eremomyces bilateralis CBS 781.70]KAF1811479.1 hypothetical protein P152DRAFT_459416 [Eremomyces bilateralis CBS 781.70]